MMDKLENKHNDEQVGLNGELVWCCNQIASGIRLSIHESRQVGVGG